MTTKTVTNAIELAETVLEQLSEMFKQTFEPYTYTINPNGTIIVFNDDGMKCLEISDTAVTMRDIIQDAYNDAVAEELVKIRQKEINDLFDIFDGLSELHGGIKVHAEPSVTYKAFKYFNEYEAWHLQMQNDSTDVLPFESTGHINTMKELILKDLAEKWKTKTH